MDNKPHPIKRQKPELLPAFVVLSDMKALRNFRILQHPLCHNIIIFLGMGNRCFR